MSSAPASVQDPTRWQTRGPLRISADRTHLVHADGAPFFVLSDTAWNGALLSGHLDWEIYLEDRAAKGFTAIQFITHAPWAGAPTNGEGLTALTDDPARRINEHFFDRIERRIESINERGMLAVPVLAWAADFGKSSRMNIGCCSDERLLARFIRYQVERFNKHQVLWVLAGDGVYNLWRAGRWKRIGRSIFRQTAGEQRHLVSLHPAGRTWPYRHFRHERWLDLYGYQSSHSEHPRTLRWLQQGPPANFWRKHPRPVINLEPVYEGIAPVPGQHPFDDAAVRRAIWWSLLCAPPAGVSYGAHGVWCWHEQAREALNHEGMGIAPPWRVAMNFPGSTSMKHLADFLGGIRWWTLRPDRQSQFLVAQPHGHEPRKFVSAARSESGDLAVVFTPCGGTLRLDPGRIDGAGKACWFDPRTGKQCDATASAPGVFPAPDDRDWVLWIAREA